jgi:hypothetical protein
MDRMWKGRFRSWIYQSAVLRLKYVTRRAILSKASWDKKAPVPISVFPPGFDIIIVQK